MAIWDVMGCSWNLGFSFLPIHKEIPQAKQEKKEKQGMFL